MIPVVPAAHYTCGGVATTLAAETTLPGLYACGEVACTGLHGANRLASNSLLEAVVMAHRGAEAVEAYLKAEKSPRTKIPAWVDLGGGTEDERVVVSHNWDELRRTMGDYVGIMRTTKRLERARTRIANLKKEISRLLLEFLGRAAPARAAKPRAGCGDDRGMRPAAARKPRDFIARWISRASSGSRGIRL